MEQILNKPIQVFATCSTKGEFTPIRFRFEANNCEIVTVDVEVLSKDGRTGIQYNKFMHYACRGEIYGRIRTFILCYIISEHRWTLLKYVS